MIVPSEFVYYTSVWAAAGLTVLSVFPAFAYFRRGLAIKKMDIISRFSPRAKILYLNTFFNESIGVRPPAAGNPQHKTAAQIAQEQEAQKKADEDAANTRFEQIYEQRYGLYRYTVPMILFGLCCFAATYLFCQSAAAAIAVATGETLTPLRDVYHSAPIYIIPDVAAAGVAGAYLWIVADIISSTKRLNFAPADLLTATLRLAMSASIAMALVGTVKPDSGAKWFALSLAFAVGAFPLSAIRAMFRRFAANTLKLGGDDESKDQILNLDGVDVFAADRLHDADITTILQLAYCDPVQLSIRTGLNFNVVTDLCSQALAWLYLGDRLNDLRGAGLRGAMEIRDFLNDYRTKPAGTPPSMANLLAVVVLLPKDPATPAPVAPGVPPPPTRPMSSDAFLYACEEIAGDPYTEFLAAIWADS